MKGDAIPWVALIHNFFKQIQCYRIVLNANFKIIVIFSNKIRNIGYGFFHHRISRLIDNEMVCQILAIVYTPPSITVGE